MKILQVSSLVIAGCPEHRTSWTSRNYLFLLTPLCSGGVCRFHAIVGPLLKIRLLNSRHIAVNNAVHYVNRKYCILGSLLHKLCFGEGCVRRCSTSANVIVKKLRAAFEDTSTAANDGKWNVEVRLTVKRAFFCVASADLGYIAKGHMPSSINLNQ